MQNTVVCERTLLNLQTPIILPTSVRVQVLRVLLLPASFLIRLQVHMIPST
jgi:hypothetical protein